MANEQEFTSVIKLEGVDETMAVLRSIPEEFRKKIAYKAVVAGSRVILAKEKELAPVAKADKFVKGKQTVTPGLLRDKIALFRESKPDKFGGNIVYHVGFRMFTKKYVNNAMNRKLKRVRKRYKVPGPAWYAMFVEWGLESTGWGRPGQKGQHFAAHAIEQAGGAAIAKTQETLNALLDKFVAQQASDKNSKPHPGNAS